LIYNGFFKFIFKTNCEKCLLLFYFFNYFRRLHSTRKQLKFKYEAYIILRQCQADYV